MVHNTQMHNKMQCKAYSNVTKVISKYPGISTINCNPRMQFGLYWNMKISIRGREFRCCRTQKGTT